VQSINDLRLHHQFLARGVTAVEDALHESEAYLLATQLHRGRVSSQQVNVDWLKDHYDSPSIAHLVAATASSPLDAEVTCVTRW